MEIRKATKDELTTILHLLAEGRQKMRQEGNYSQWAEDYPQKETIENDIENGNSYLVFDNEIAVATFAFIEGPDPTYLKIYQGEWSNDNPYYVIHRIASAANTKGVLKAALEYAYTITDTVRIDTHKDNKTMQAALQKYGFTYCGIIYLLNGDPRLAYLKSK